MQFTISFLAISALAMTALASPQRHANRPNRISNENKAPNQQANSCGNGFTPFCCATDRTGTSSQVACSVSSSEFAPDLLLLLVEIEFDELPVGDE